MLNQSSSPASLNPPTPVPTPYIRRKVFLLNHRRRSLHLDKDLIDSTVEALSSRYKNGSLFQDLQTNTRKLHRAHLMCTGAWTFARESHGK